ncbi:MAG: acyl-CoA thioesterase II [Myxococcales bacterium]|nr:acyl-CoA thioesterase II [Myxococcales bacterium]
MKPVLADLLSMLRLERIEEHIFRGQSQDLGWGAVFGGQVLGQALSAAEQTVPADRHPHSLHAYFLRRGDASRPIVYEVDPIRDGRSFTTRRVVAIQGGKAIFNLSASFHVEESGFSHQDQMPIVAGPEGLKSIRELTIERASELPPRLAAMATAARPIDIRPITRHDPMNPEAAPPHRMLWYRAADTLPDDPRLHAYLLAYASDSHFIGTALEPHGVSWLTGGMQVASLDHAMWFHRPFRLDEWLLYVVDSPSASGATGLVRGRFFRRDGVLVASTAQEGLMRRR